MAIIVGAVDDCGNTSYLMVMLAIVALMGAVAAAIVVFGSKARWLGIMLSAITACLGVAICGVGEYGELRARKITDRVLASGIVDPSRIENVREASYRESAQCISVGIGCSALPLIFGLVLLPVALLKKKPEPSEK